MDMGWHPKDGFLVRKIREGWFSEYGRAVVRVIRFVGG